MDGFHFHVGYHGHAHIAEDEPTGYFCIRLQQPLTVQSDMANDKVQEYGSVM